jgi:hypothetical protein
VKEIRDKRRTDPQPSARGQGKPKGSGRPGPAGPAGPVWPILRRLLRRMRPHAPILTGVVLAALATTATELAVLAENSICRVGRLSRARVRVSPVVCGEESSW